MRTVWHIEKKAVGEHEYFGSLTALWRKYGAQVGVSKSKIEKDSRNLDAYSIETETQIIRKGKMLSVSDVVLSSG
jgi:hypothetical protein